MEGKCSAIIDDHEAPYGRGCLPEQNEKKKKNTKIERRKQRNKEKVKPSNKDVHLNRYEKNRKSMNEEENKNGRSSSQWNYW